MKILIAMILIMPFEKNPYLKLADSLLGIPDFTMIKLLGMIGLVWVLMELASGRVQLRILESRPGKAFVLFLGWVAFAGLVSGAALVPVTKMLAIALFLPLILTAVRSEDNLWLASRAAAATMILIFPYALRNLIRFSGVGGRLGVGINEPNYFALALVLLVPLPLIFVRHVTDRRERLFWVAGFVVLSLAIVMTGSRGGALGFVFMALLYTLRLSRRRLQTLSGLACLFLLLLIAVPNTLGQRLWGTVDPEAQTLAARLSDRTRLSVLLGGLRMIQANPVTGVGLGNFKQQVVRYGAIKGKMAHNTYIQMAAELGLPALMAFGLFVLLVLLSLRRSERLAAVAGNARMKDLAIGMQVGLAGYLVSATFLSAQYEKFFWLVAFLGIATERILRAQVEPAPRRVAVREAAWTAR